HAGPGRTFLERRAFAGGLSRRRALVDHGLDDSSVGSARSGTRPARALALAPNRGALSRDRADAGPRFFLDRHPHARTHRAGDRACGRRRPFFLTEFIPRCVSCCFSWSRPFRFRVSVTVTTSPRSTARWTWSTAASMAWP